MKRRFVSFALALSLALSVFAAIPFEADAATTSGYYNSYSTISYVSNYDKATAMQGMAADDDYLYTVKIRSDESRAIISKTHRITKSTTMLTDSATGVKYITGIGHANGMDTVQIDGKTNLLIASMHDAENGLVRVIVDGTKFTKAANHTVKCNGTAVKVTGVAVIANDGENLTLLFKRGEDFYTGTLPIGATGGDINLTLAFRTDKSAVTINGKTEDISAYINQGFGYYGGKIYVPMWNSDKQNQSVVIVYNIEGAQPTDTIYGEKDLSFRITSGTYKTFEIEDVAFAGDGKMYFNTNMAKDTDGNYDGVFCFKNFTAFDAPTETMGKKYTMVYNANGGSGRMSNTTVEYGTATMISTNRFYRTGYVFKGWAAKRSSDGKWLYSKGTTKKWYKEGSQPSGYSKHYYTDNAYVSAQSSVANDTVTMYAQWQKIYYVKYTANGGTGTMSNSTIKYGVSTALKPCTFEREGYEFTGWTAKRASDGKWLYSKGTTKKWYAEGKQPSGYKKHVYKDMGSVSAQSSTAGDTVTLYAQWKKI